MKKVEISGMRAWCGPTALAAITGQRYWRMIKVIEDVRGQGNFEGTCNWLEMLKALERTSVKVEDHRRVDCSLSEFMTKVRPGELFLVRVTGHFMVVEGQKICDSYYTRGEVLPFPLLPRGAGGKQLTHWARLEAQGDSTTI